METMKVKGHVGSDGILKLEVPVGGTDRDLEVVVVIESLATTDDESAAARAEWLAFIEQTAGSLADDPIERLPQGDFDVRDEIQ
jgi:hypothetical protein